MTEIGRLTSSLQEAPDKIIKACLLELIGALWSFPVDVDTEQAINAYVKVLAPKGFGPVIAVKNKMLQGEYDFCAKGFLPIPAGFARLCDDEHQGIRNKINELRRADHRRLAIWNTLPDSWNNRQREAHIDALIAKLDEAP